MIKLLFIAGTMYSTGALAHVSHTSQAQHSAEHLLLAALLIPIAWMIARKVFK